MVVKRLHTVALGFVALGTGLAGCGQLEIPDLQTGAVRGTVSGVTASGGYVYVLGAPQLRAGLAPDGAYRLDGVPVGSAQVVVVAAAGGAMRAQVFGVVVESRTATRLDQDAGAMALAGRIITAVKPAGGSRADGAHFTLEQTVHQNVAGPGAVLAGLPAGSWTLTTTMPGFHPRSGSHEVAEGADTFVDETIDVDDADEQRGCLSSGCGFGLHCNAADGWCYACLVDADCGSGAYCDTSGSRTCVADQVAGAFCELADADAKCAHGVRILTSGGLGYCTAACTAAGDPACPAGWSCDLAAGLCAVSRVCSETAETWGSSCASSSPACTTDLAGGKCLRLSEDAAGFCTAPCTTDQQCIDAGFGTCTAVKDGIRYCQR